MQDYECKKMSYYYTAISSSIIRILIRSLYIYIVWNSTNNLFNSQYVNFSSTNSSLVYEEANMFSIPISFVCFLEIAEIGLMISSLVRNKKVRIINYGTLIFISSFLIFINFVLFLGFKKIYNLVLLIIESITLIHISIIFWSINNKKFKVILPIQFKNKSTLKDFASTIIQAQVRKYLCRIKIHSISKKTNEIKIEIDCEDIM